MRRRLPILAAGGIAAILLLSLGGVAGYFFRGAQSPFDAQTLPEEAISLLETYYIDPLPLQLDLERGMVRGLVDVLDDPFTKYVDPVTHEIRTDNLSGEYAGIGVEIAHNEDGQIFMIPIPGGSADIQGIIEGDILIRIDDYALPAWVELNQVTSRLRGESGSEVMIQYRSAEKPNSPIQANLTRSIFPLPSVVAYKVPDHPTIGVVKLSMFSEQTITELERAYEELTAGGATALVLDLRGNGGGLLDSAVEVARFFLVDGVIIYEQHRDEPLTKYEVEQPGIGADIPLVVIVDRGSASGAEVVAAAIGANHRAEIIGEKTYGKGSVQVIVELTDGSSLNITSARWLTPEMESMDGLGIEPDIPVEATRADLDQALMTAVSRLSARP